MEKQDSTGKIVKETFPSEIVSIIGDLLAGIVLILLILPFASFLILILIIPALLSLRGNISGPFIARTSKDLIVGEFNRKSWIENVSATFTLSIITALLIGIFAIVLNIMIIKIYILPNEILIVIPLLTMLLTLIISLPTSTILNYLTFKFGFDPNSVVHPIMTALDDFLTVIFFYITLIILGVP